MARNDEAKIQAAIVSWVRTVAPDAVCFAVPNGLHLSKSQAAKSKWTGCLAGVPDLAVVHGGRIFFIEVKADKGRLSDDQAQIIAKLDGQGAVTRIVKSIDDVRAAFELWSIPTREVAFIPQKPALPQAAKKPVEWPRKAKAARVAKKKKEPKLDVESAELPLFMKGVAA